MSKFLHSGKLEPSTDDTEAVRIGLLATNRRRLTTVSLVGTSAPLEVDELAGIVAEREPGIDHADDRAVERVAIPLHHDHLPTTSDLGVLDYDRGSNVAESFDTSAPLR